jgi:hypothetical protein
MSNNENTANNQPQLSRINLTKLPVQLQLELIDFYEFLIQKYHIENENNQPHTHFRQFLESPLQVPEIKPWTREDLHER